MDKNSQIGRIVLTNLLKNYKNINIKNFEKQISMQLGQFLFQKIDRKPLIVPIINILEKE